MNLIISTEDIKNTKVFQNLHPCYQKIAIKLTSQKSISNGLLVWRNSKIISGSVGGNNLKILKELIENENN